MTPQTSLAMDKRVDTAHDTDHEPGWDHGCNVSVDDDMWASAARELRPDKSLARVTGTARTLVSSVSLVAAALTALGLVGTSLLAGHPLLGFLAGVAVVLALGAVVVALSYGWSRPEVVNTENQVQVRAWYERQFRRIWRVTLATWLLIAAVVLAAVVGIGALIVRSPDSPALTLTQSGLGTERTLTLAVTVAGQEPGSSILVTLSGAQGQVLFRAAGAADGAGNASISGKVEKAPASAEYRLQAQVADRTSVLTLT